MSGGRSAEAPTLLCVAEAWGFGPAAKLFAVIRALSPRPRVVLACTGTSATYGQLNADLVDELIVLEESRDVLDVAAEADAVLTVMDPWAALLGARRGIPTVYVDSLFWFWNWDRLDFDAAFREAARWVRLDHAEARQATAAALDWHQVVPMAYAWSSRVFVQRTPAAAARLAHYREHPVEAVGAVVAAPANGTASASGPPLISVAGAISHTTPLPVARHYAELVATVLDAVRDRIGDAVVTGNPAVLPIFERHGWNVRALDAVAMLEAMAAAPFVLAPAGLTTALEAAALGVPLAFLPEQHAGHAPNRDILAAADPGAYDDLLLRRWFDLRSTEPAVAIADLDRCYQRLLADGAGELRAAAAAAVGALLDPAERARRAARQRRCALAVVGDFRGAQTIAAAVTDAIGDGYPNSVPAGRSRISSP